MMDCDKCVPGCDCPEGQVRDYFDNCVDPADCPCQDEENRNNRLLYEPGATLMRGCDDW